MKPFIVLACMAFITNMLFAQRPEFTYHANGLIYPDTTMRQLKYIVDSLNLKFKVCDLHKTYKTRWQARGHYIMVKGSLKHQAEADIEKELTYNEFIRKYKPEYHEENLLIYRYPHKNYEDKDVLSFYSVGFTIDYPPSIEFSEDLQRYAGTIKSKWVYHKTDRYLEAFYLESVMQPKTLPEKYARMVQYAECLVDTNHSIFFESATSDYRHGNEIETVKVDAFMKYVHKATYRPEFDDNNYAQSNARLRAWDSLRFHRLDSLKKSDRKFNLLFQEALQEANAKGGTHDEFEEYVERYYSSRKALEFKRKRIVVGGCSADQRPRVHAFEIARLAATTTSWEIFLRAHLDIMNDNFSRVSDGSYAWGGRKTYIRELEELDINVPDLLLGVCLRVENPSAHHYHGDIGRTGRALAESNEAIEVESRILQLVRDSQVDDFNRMLFYFLFTHFNHHLKDEERKKSNELKLAEAKLTLPAFLTAGSK